LAKFDSAVLGTVTCSQPWNRTISPANHARWLAATAPAAVGDPLSRLILSFTQSHRPSNGRVFLRYSLNSSVKRGLDAPLDFFTSN
jgi:hypothetical protein